MGIVIRAHRIQAPTRGPRGLARSSALPERGRLRQKPISGRLYRAWYVACGGAGGFSEPRRPPALHDDQEGGADQRRMVAHKIIDDTVPTGEAVPAV